MLNNTEIKSERFVQRALTVEDATLDYLDWLDGSTIKKYITYASQKRSLEELKSYIAAKVACEDTLFMGIFLKEDGRHIGNIKYEPVDIKNSYAVMGIMIGDESWRGKGVAPEVIHASATWLNKEIGIRQIILGVDVRNQSAINSYKKLGFVIQKTPYIDINSDDHLSMVWNL